MCSGSTNSMTSSISDVRQSEMTLSMTSSAPRSAVRHVEMRHRVIAVAGQIVGELGRNAFLAGQADDRAAPQRPAFQGARQHEYPSRPVREKRHDADRPEQENVAARQVVAHTPAENARGQDQESPAPGAQHAASLVVPYHQPGGAVELLHPHRGDEQNGDEDGRRNSVRIFARRTHRGSCDRSPRRTSRSPRISARSTPSAVDAIDP